MAPTDNVMPADPLPHQVVDFGEGKRALRANRDAAVHLAHYTCLCDADTFASWMSVFQMRSAQLVQTRMSHVIYHRSSQLVGRSGIDDYMISVYLHGESRVQLGAREITVGPGDIKIVDLAAATRTFVLPPRGARTAEYLTLVLPRARLAPLLAMPDAVGCEVIRGDTPYGRILRDLLLGLWRRTRELGLAETEPIIDAAATLIAGGLRPTAGSELHIAHVEHAAKRASIKRFLDRVHPSRALDVGALCRTFGVSRATLYRMFEPDGGIVHYARERQLRRALAMVRSPVHKHLRILDIALNHGFRSESGFIRAFRRSFGITPGEARASGAARHAAANTVAPALAAFET